MADRQARQLSTPHRFNSLVAAANVITARGISSPGQPVGSKQQGWQQRASGFYDSVGEFRFGVTWLANGLSRINLVAARPPEQVGDEPTAINPDDDDTTPGERRAVELVEFIGGGAAGQGQLLAGFGRLLSIGGFAWLIAEPDLTDPTADEYETWQVYSQSAVKTEPRPGGDDESDVFVATGKKGQEQWREVHPNALVVQAWRQHPERPWEPDAPVRACLGLLDQIALLSAHVTATGRSRLAGAGVFVVPSEAVFPPPPPPEDDDADPDAEERDGFDYFVDQLTEAMTIPIAQPDNASAVVPLVVQVPGEFVDKVKHLRFGTEFDAQLLGLLEAAIKRFALGMDMPPEVLTGMAGVNHWTAWQVEETGITLHIEPNAEIVCQALTEGYLSLALAAEGLDPSTAMVWYDTADLTSPPDKSGSAVSAYDRIELSGQALRREGGFVEEDAPDDEERRERLLLKLAESQPATFAAVLEMLGMLDSAALPAAPAEEPPTTPEEPEEPEPPAQGPPEQERPEAASLRELVLACDGVAFRAMELAGKRLRTAVGKRDGSPLGHVEAASLHTLYDPTVYADLDHLLADAFVRVPELAAELSVDGEALTATLNAYCRSLLAAQHEHDRHRLAAALGADASV